MTPAQYIFLGSCELIALAVIYRVWRSTTHSLAGKILWSVFILIPVFGALMYAFLVPNAPSKHPYGQHAQNEFGVTHKDEESEFRVSP